MAKKVWIFVAAGIVAALIITGIVALLVHAVNYNPSPRPDVWEDEDEPESSYYRDDPTTTTRETQGRDYYENGGYKGMDSYFIIQDMTTE